MEKPIVLGIDIGGSHITAALVKSSDKIKVVGILPDGGKMSWMFSTK